MHPSVQKMVDMGFPEEAAKKALLDSKGMYVSTVTDLGNIALYF
jgi:hypothetical protein